MRGTPSRRCTRRSRCSGSADEVAEPPGGHRVLVRENSRSSRASIAIARRVIACVSNRDPRPTPPRCDWPARPAPTRAPPRPTRALHEHPTRFGAASRNASASSRQVAPSRSIATGGRARRRAAGRFRSSATLQVPAHFDLGERRNLHCVHAAMSRAAYRRTPGRHWFSRLPPPARTTGLCSAFPPHRNSSGRPRTRLANHAPRPSAVASRGRWSGARSRDGRSGLGALAIKRRQPVACALQLLVDRSLVEDCAMSPPVRTARDDCVMDDATSPHYQSRPRCATASARSSRSPTGHPASISRTGTPAGAAAVGRPARKRPSPLTRGGARIWAAGAFCPSNGHVQLPV